MEQTNYTYSQQGGAQQPPMPKTYFLESILTLLFCCLPLGIIALIKANSVESLYRSGDYVGSERASQEAKKYIKWSLIGAVLVYGLYAMILLGLGGLSYFSY